MYCFLKQNRKLLVIMTRLGMKKLQLVRTPCPTCLRKYAVIDGKTNHSMRATGATMLFQNEIPERVIQTVTGHKSLMLLDHMKEFQQSNIKKLALL